jgi:hypothetical protein
MNLRELELSAVDNFGWDPRPGKQDCSGRVEWWPRHRANGPLIGASFPAGVKRRRVLRNRLPSGYRLPRQHRAEMPANRVGIRGRCGVALDVGSSSYPATDQPATSGVAAFNRRWWMVTTTTYRDRSAVTLPLGFRPRLRPGGGCCRLLLEHDDVLQRVGVVPLGCRYFLQIQTEISRP